VAVSSVKRILTGYMCRNVAAIFVASEYSDGSLITDIFVFRDGVYYMAFSSTSKPLDGPLAGYPSGMMLCVMGATSVDGVHWHKREEPLLIAQCDSVFPPRAAAARVGDFHRPTLMWDEQQQAWKLYFDYYNASLPGNCHMGLAECRGDFRTGRFDFVHSLDEPLLDNWPNPEVVKIGTGYYCFSDPPGYAPADKTRALRDGQPPARRLFRLTGGIGRRANLSRPIPESLPARCRRPRLPPRRQMVFYLFMPRRSAAGTTAVGTNGSAGDRIGLRPDPLRQEIK
ncbi:MAG: hypothetical protein ACLUEV_06890, partial [Alistipes sp.]